MRKSFESVAYTTSENVEAFTFTQPAGRPDHNGDDEKLSFPYTVGLHVLRRPRDFPMQT